MSKQDNPTPALTRGAIIGQPKQQRCDNPDWGGVHYSRNMTALQRVAFEAQVQAIGDGADFFAHYMGVVVAHTCCDENGERLFSDDDAARLVGDEGVDFEGLHRAYRHAVAVNRLQKSDQEELAKN